MRRRPFGQQISNKVKEKKDRDGDERPGESDEQVDAGEGESQHGGPAKEV